MSTICSCETLEITLQSVPDDVPDVYTLCGCGNAAEQAEEALDDIDSDHCSYLQEAFALICRRSEPWTVDYDSLSENFRNSGFVRMFSEE